MGYSQNDEERVILEHFDARPADTLLDIGAHDGKTFSNTAALIERGWSGVLVEPSPKPFSGLLERYRGRPDLRLVNAAVVDGGEPRLLPWWDARGDCTSTLSPVHAQTWRELTPFTEMFLVALPVQKLLDLWPWSYRFVSIDTEGTSVDILLALPFDEMGTELVCVEHDRRLKDVERVRLRYGFEIIHENGENYVMRRSL